MDVKHIRFMRPSSLNMPIDSEHLEDSELPRSIRTLLSQNDSESVTVATVSNEDGSTMYVASGGKFRALDLREGQPPIVLCYLMEAQGSGYVYIEGHRRVFSFGEGYGVEEINQARMVAHILSDFLEEEIEELNFGAVR